MNVFSNRVPDFSKFLPYGFEKTNGGYLYSAPMVDGQFELQVKVSAGGEVETLLTDSAAGEPYVLHLVEGAGGAFVGRVRKEYFSVLSDIAENCFERQVFVQPAAKALIARAAAKYGDRLQFLWEKLPQAAVLRRADTQKWYAVFMAVPLCKLGLNGEGTAEVADLRVPAGEVENLCKESSFLPAYHMNKKHWITALLNGCIPEQKLLQLLDESYFLAK